jgi:hypothetical protein
LDEAAVHWKLALQNDPGNAAARRALEQVKSKQTDSK